MYVKMLIYLTAKKFNKKCHSEVWSIWN